MATILRLRLPRKLPVSRCSRPNGTTRCPLPHRLSRHRALGYGHVRLLLLRLHPRNRVHHLVRHPDILRRQHLIRYDPMHFRPFVGQLRKHASSKWQRHLKTTPGLLYGLVDAISPRKSSCPERQARLGAHMLQVWIHPRSMRWIFTVKGFTMPAAAFGLFGWCMAHGGGLSGMNLAAPSGSAVMTPLGWSIMAGVNSIFGALSPMIVNQPDLARYCKKPSDAGALQGVSVFGAGVLVFFLGEISALSGAFGAFG